MEKIDTCKFIECPISAITAETWELIRLVNRTTDSDGNIINLPFPGTILEQPEWYLQAVDIVIGERNSEWYREWKKEEVKAKKL